MNWISALACAAALCGAAPAFAQTPAEGGDEIWDLSAPATPRHWHTGLTCWPNAGDTPLSRRMAYNSTGADVSCNYSDTHSLATLYVTQRPLDEPAAPVIADGRRQVLERYGGARVVSDGRRAIQTSAGALDIDEFVLAIDGQDVRQHERMRGATGVWHADVAGWTLKLRLSDYRAGSAGDLPLLAETLIGRAYADMQTARACASAGRESAPNLAITSDEQIPVQVAGAAMMPAIVAAVPATPLAARRAGFVCLGEVLATQDGVDLVGVTPAHVSAERRDAVLLGLGEIRSAGTAAAMVALVDMSMNPFGLDGARSDRGHFIFAVRGDTAGFYGVLSGGEVRRTLARVAGRVHDGAQPLVQSSPPAH